MKIMNVHGKEKHFWLLVYKIMGAVSLVPNMITQGPKHLNLKMSRTFTSTVKF